MLEPKAPMAERRSMILWALGLVVLSIAGGCGAPSAANILLRKQNQTLQSQVDNLTSQHQRDIATLAACQRSHPTVPTLPTQRLDQLFTTHDLTFGSLTGGDNPDSTKNFDTELEVFIAPVDEQGTAIKAAGSFKVEAFDLADPKHPQLGTWAFDLKQTRDLFYNRFGMYEYVLRCPWQTVPTHPDLTVRVTFDDALTGREFISQTQAKLRPPNRP
jgi:hypothetical protein